MQNIAKNGDNIVSSTDIYGGTWNLFANTFKDQGIESRFADPSDLKILKIYLMKEQEPTLEKLYPTLN